MPIAGKTLRRERLLAEVSVTALGARMKLSRQALWAVERAAEVDRGRAEAYRKALAEERGDVSETSEAVA